MLLLSGINPQKTIGLVSLKVYIGYIDESGTSSMVSETRQEQ